MNNSAEALRYYKAATDWLGLCSMFDFYGTTFWRQRMETARLARQSKPVA